MKKGHAQIVRAVLIIALISSWLGFATGADLANAEASAWMQTDGVITAHEVPCGPALAAASLVRPSCFSAGTKHQVSASSADLAPALARPSSSHDNARPDVAHRAHAGQVRVVSGRSPPHSNHRI